MLMPPFFNCQFIDDNGTPLASGLLYTYDTGTTTPRTSYADQAGASPNANPIVLDAAGRCNLWLTAGVEYRLVLKRADASTVFTRDDVLGMAAGTTGTAGTNSATVRLWQRTATATPPSVATSGSTIYTFATGGVTGQPAGWTATDPGSGSGAYQWSIQQTASSSATTATLVNTGWGSPVLISQSGSAGSSSRMAYALYTGNPPPSGSSVAIVGTPPAGLPLTTSWAFATAATAWSVGTQTPAAGQALFQAVGTYEPGTNTTTWQVPFLSSLRVGSLSAISADLGTITAGSINTTGYIRADGTTSLTYPDPASLAGTLLTIAMVANVGGTARVGVGGMSTASAGVGVYGYNNYSAGTSYGVFGLGSTGVLGKPHTSGAGIQGEASVTANSKGVYGVGGGASTFGVYGSTPFAGGGTAVAADASSGGTALAVTGLSTFSSGNVVLNGTGAALLTTATSGFPFIPTCAGTPTGVPGSIPTGTVPMVFDTTGVKLWIYTGGTWKGVTVA